MQSGFYVGVTGPSPQVLGVVFQGTGWQRTTLNLSRWERDAMADHRHEQPAIQAFEAMVIPISVGHRKMVVNHREAWAKLDATVDAFNVQGDGETEMTAFIKSMARSIRRAIEEHGMEHVYFGLTENLPDEVA